MPIKSVSGIIDNSSIANRTVLEKIYDWSKGRSLWQRDALRRILQKSIIEDQDIDELKVILKSEKEGKLKGLSATPLSENDLPANPDAGEAVSLKNLENISHVNNLAVDQKLEFGEHGITVIYGDNGSGKSGYTRILKSVCRARHRDRILTNIFAPEFKNETPSADITYNTASHNENTINWEDSDKPDSILSAVSVFDRECASVHIKRKNEIAFRPYGLDIPDTLAEVCKKVEDCIKAEIGGFDRSKNAIFTNPPWSTSTDVGKFATEINKDTKQEDLDNITQFSVENEERLKFLAETLSKDIHKAAREEELKAQRLERFRNELVNITALLSEEKVKALLQQRQNAEDSKQAAELAASKLLEEDLLPNIGGRVWKKLWEAAREYSTEIAYQQKDFPNTDDGAKCILCQQELSNDSKMRLQTFEKHVSSDLERKAKSEKNAYDKLLEKAVFDYICFSEYAEILEDISLQSPELLKLTKRYLASIRLRQIRLNMFVKNNDDVKLSSYAPSPFGSIHMQIKKHKDGAEELKKSANAEGIAKLKAEKQELTDKKAINDQKQAFLDEITRLKTIDFLNECLNETKTRSITTLGNNIADVIITPKIRDRFQKEIVDFVGSRLRVEIQRSGGSYGSPHYKLSLLSSPGTDLSTVLSEGEQTCVAIAAFLAELATSSHKSALVFDDPVSSLDHKWRHKVAERLVKEAKERQVIVFTHDLIFLNDIEDAAEELGVEFSSMHLTHFPNMVGVVNDNLPWDGMKIMARIDALEKEARKLSNSRNSLSDEDYKSKARDFYSITRASWERALEEVGLSHVIMRHRDYINVKNINNLSALDIEACEAWYKAWSRCCDYVSAHDGSRGRNQSMPEPDKLIQDVGNLASWVKHIKEAHKNIAKNLI